MMWINKYKQYPLILWAMALYMCSLGFNLKYDIPLAIFAAVSILTIGNMDHSTSLKIGLKKYWPVAFFVLTAIVVTIFSRDSSESIWMQLQLLPALLVCLAISFCVNKPDTRQFVIVSLVFTAWFTQLIFMTQILYLDDIPDRLEKMWAIESPLLIAPNDVLFFSIWAPLAACLVVEKTTVGTKVLGGVYLVTTLFVTAYMQSRQAVGVYFGSLFLMALLWRPALGAAIVVLGALLVFIVDWFTGKGLLNKLVFLFPRRYVWEAAWQMFLDRPWTGHGPGMFKEFYVEYLGKAGYVFEQVEDRRPMNWAHSLYLEQLAERGVLGFLGLLSIVGTAIQRLLRSKIEQGLFQRALLSCWAAYLMAGIAESSLLRLWAMMGLFILFGLTACHDELIYSKKQ